MSKIAIVADSTICPTKEQQERYHFEVVPLNVLFEGRVYRDWIDFSPTEAYQFLEKNPNDFATSAPSPGDFLAAFKKVAKEGKKEILCLTVTTKVSATWNSARMAKSLAESELPGIKIEVMDSGTGATGLSLLCIKAANAIEEGKNFEEIIRMIENIKNKVKTYLLLETIRYIYRSGRIPEVASKIGALLPLKPILLLGDYELKFSGAAGSKNSGIKKLLETLKKDFDETMPEVGIMHATSPSEAEQLKEKVALRFPQAKIFISELSPVIGYATGKGTIMLGFFAKN